MSYNWNVGSGLGFMLSLDNVKKSRILITAGHTLGGQPPIGATVTVTADGRLVNATLLGVKDTGSGPDIAVLCMPSPEPAYQLGSVTGDPPTEVVFARRSEKSLIQGRASIVSTKANGNQVAVASPKPDHPATGDSGAVVVLLDGSGAATDVAVAVVTDRLDGTPDSMRYAFTLLQPQLAWIRSLAGNCV